VKTYVLLLKYAFYLPLTYILLALPVLREKKGSEDKDKSRATTLLTIGIISFFLLLT